MTDVAATLLGIYLAALVMGVIAGTVLFLSNYDSDSDKVMSPRWRYVPAAVVFWPILVLGAVVWSVGAIIRDATMRRRTHP